MKKEELEPIEFPDQKIVDIKVEEEISKSFIEYAMSVIVARALPDARDGLKPVHRRILYSMYEEGLTHEKAFSKSAKTVGYVLGAYHPHGDTAVYEAMVRMAQDFSLRYPLVEGHGNFGNIDGDGAAAYRYTEARMAKLTELMLADIRKDVVNFVPNFDNSTKEPEVLPARFPNLLVNGAVGIAVGMATNVPPHNLCEVIDGTVALIDDPGLSIADLMQYIKGPDFPTGASIYGENGIREAYYTGRGRITVRAKAEVDEEKHRIVVTEIPYAVNKANLDKAIGDCVNEKRVEGVTALRDESDQKGLRIVIEYRKDVSGQILLNQLYKFTQLQDTFAVNMLALVHGEPKVLNLKQMLEVYIDHQREVIVRRTKFDLNKALHDAHLNEGFKLAIDHIDEVIRIIRASASVNDAKEALMKAFTADDVDNLIGEGGKEGLSEEQAQAIVDMPLGRLAGLEQKKIEAALKALMEAITEYEAILHEPAKVNAILRDELLAVRAKYGDERRTEIVPVENEIEPEDLIERHVCLITMSRDGYVKRQPADTFNAQKRGGKGIIGMKTKEEDDVAHMLAVNSHSDLLLFTNTGKVHVMRAFRVPEAGRAAKGTNVVNLIEAAPGERVTSMIALSSWDDGRYLTMVTKNGIVKRTPVSEYEYQRRGGKIAISLDDGDELSFVLCTDGRADIVVATKNGYAVRFAEEEAREMGRSARGVIAIRPEEGDYVVGVALVSDEKTLFTLTENGYGKRTSFDEFRAMHRGGKGVRVHNLTDKTGSLVGIASVCEEDDLMLITLSGTVIRTPVSGINLYSRTAAGVIVMRTDEGVVSSFTVVGVENDGEDLTEPEDAPEEAEAPDTGTVAVEDEEI